MMKFSAQLLSLIAAFLATASNYSPEQASPVNCDNFAFVDGNTPLNAESLGLVQAVAIAGPNGTVSYTGPDKDPKLKSLEYIAPLTGTIDKDFPAFDHELHENENGLGDAKSDLHFTQNINASGCQILVTSKFSKAFSANANVYQIHCDDGTDPEPYASAKASGNVFQVLTIKFKVIKEGQYQLGAQLFAGKCSLVGWLERAKGSVTLSNASGVLKVVKVEPVGRNIGPSSLEKIHLTPGLYYLTCVIDVDDSSKEIEAKCSHTDLPTNCNSSDSFYFSLQPVPQNPHSPSDGFIPPFDPHPEW